ATTAVTTGDQTFRVDWEPLALEPGAPTPDAVRVTTAEDVHTVPAGYDGLLLLDLADDPETIAGGAVQGIADAARVRASVGRVLDVVQAWLAEPSWSESRLLVVTRFAAAVEQDAEPLDAAGSAVCGLLRSAQAEHPGRIVLVDTDQSPASQALVAAACALDEPHVALRDGVCFVRRLVRAGSAATLVPPAQASAWRLAAGAERTLAGLEFRSAPEAEAELAAGQIRIAVRAAGLNFRDVMIGLGMYPDPDAELGTEGAGVVTEIGADISGLKVGDRVFGIFPGAAGPVAVADRRLVARMPGTWTFEEAASVPTVFLTAYHAVHDVAGLQAGERILVHAAAGGVGMAAVQLARHRGAEVFATASPGKWDSVGELGVPGDRMAHSRTLDFEDQFRTATGGEGVDVVLNALAGDFIDASLRLLPRGGRFVELGRTDVRDAAQIAAEHPGVAYDAFVLAQVDNGRVQEMLTELIELFEQGALQLSPVTVWDVRRAPAAFRSMSQGRHIGKNVFVLPRTLDPGGTALVTGGTGTLGRMVARRLVERHGVRTLILASRNGPSAPGASEFEAELAELGARAHTVACDLADRAAVRELFATVPADAPLTAVVHTAGVLDDGVITALDAGRLDAVFRPKVDAALNLQELTQDLDLAAFVLFSSAAGTFESPGQGNYAAANAFLDALARNRRARGLPATSLGWGLWAQATSLSGHLTEADQKRMARGGMAALSVAEGMDLFDAALGALDPALVLFKPAFAGLQGARDPGSVPALLRGLVSAGRRSAHDAGTGGDALAKRLARADAVERDQILLGLVRHEVTTILGYREDDQAEPDRALSELGFDSLTSVELRNRLSALTGLRLPATLIFNYPTPAALTGYLREQLGGTQPEQEAESDSRREGELRRVLTSLPMARFREAGVLDVLLALARSESGGSDAAAATEPGRASSAREQMDLIDTLSADDLVQRALGAAGRS
uniref:SDR family NAD(P)-dependent oxidoreductase n=1 Tax=Catenulispora rubra TaxID=280293 RepID=UPI0018927533